MTLVQERYVASRFTELESRFRHEIEANDFRLRACVELLGDLAGARILDLGCGKGRFARRLLELGAQVIGLDGSRGMLASATQLDCVRASALRLPFESKSFDGVIAIEVFEHLPRIGIPCVLSEISRILKPNRRFAIIDKNKFALDARRPWIPKLLIKRLDERRGLWMYPGDGPVKEQWFGPRDFARLLRRSFEHVTTQYLLSPEESHRGIFRSIPSTRLMALWTGRTAEEES